MPMVIGLFSGIFVFAGSLFFCSIFGMMDYLESSEDLGLLLISYFVSMTLGLIAGYLMMT